MGVPCTKHLAADITWQCLVPFRTLLEDMTAARDRRSAVRSKTAVMIDDSRRLGTAEPIVPQGSCDFEADDAEPRRVSIIVLGLHGDELTRVQVEPLCRIAEVLRALPLPDIGYCWKLVHTDGVLEPFVTVMDASLEDESTVTALQVETESQPNTLSATCCSFAGITSNSSVVAWGIEKSFEEVKPYLDSGVANLVSNCNAFAALKHDGSVVTWGMRHCGDENDHERLKELLRSDVQSVVADSEGFAFAAVKSSGAVVTWGYSEFGGSSSAVAHQLASDVVSVIANRAAFAAIKQNGAVVTWGADVSGGDSTSQSSSLSSDVAKVAASQEAFAALKSDGSVCAWGSPAYGGDTSAVETSLRSGVVSIIGLADSFIAKKTDGSIVLWGALANSEGEQQLQGLFVRGVSSIVSSHLAGHAFVVAKDHNGRLVSIGNTDDTCEVPSCLQSDVRSIALGGCSPSSLAALKADGSVVTWGWDLAGSDSCQVQDVLCNVSRIVGNSWAFSGLKEDGSVVSWGHKMYGGDSSPVAHHTFKY